MTEREQRLLVSRALDVGERMLLCGGEVSRVEDTISRIQKLLLLLRHGCLFRPFSPEVSLL